MTLNYVFGIFQDIRDANDDVPIPKMQSDNS